MTTKQFKKIRKKKGWTQKKLAKELGVKTITVWRYENGFSIPLTVQRLMEYYKLAS